MLSVSTISVVPSQRPREKPNWVCFLRWNGVVGHVDEPPGIEFLDAYQEVVALAHEVDGERGDHDQRHGLGAAAQQVVVQRVPHGQRGFPSRRHRVTAPEHRKRVGIAHDRAPHAEDAVGIRDRLGNIGALGCPTDEIAVLACLEPGIARSEIELVTARQQYVASQNLGNVADRRRTGDGDAVADGDYIARGDSAVAHHADRGRFGVPLPAIVPGEHDLAVRVAPGNGLDLTGHLNGSTCVENPDRTVVGPCAQAPKTDGEQQRCS